MKRKRVLIILLSVLASNVFSQNYNFRNFNLEDGLANSYIYSIVQDERGYLWVGTGNGLSRYNGFEFKNFTVNDSLAHNFITSGISEGENLWFGHMNGRISFFDGKKFHSVNAPQSDLSPITHFTKSPQGHVWASTYSDGLLKLNKDSRVEKHARFMDQTTVISFEFLDDNKLLIGTNTGLFYCRLNDSEEIEFIRTVSESPKSRITCIQKTKNKPGLYIATENDGIFHLTNEGKRFRVSKIITDTEVDFTGIQEIYEDSQSNLWLCSRGKGNGLIKIKYSASEKSAEVIYLNRSDGFVTNDVNSILEDREGNIWSGNYGQGLTKITPKTFSVYTFDNPSYGNNIFSIFFNSQY
jgi:ligand-binding sensor domain-containing protein